MASELEDKIAELIEEALQKNGAMYPSELKEYIIKGLSNGDVPDDNTILNVIDKLADRFKIIANAKGQYELN